MLAHILLFDPKILDSNEEEEESLEDLLFVNKILFDVCLLEKSKQFSYDDFVSTLLSMSVYFSTNVDWDDNEMTKVQQKVINGICCLENFEGAST